MNKRIILIVAIFLMLLSLAGTAVVYERADPFDKKPRVVLIPKEYPAFRVAQLLAQKKIIKGVFGFGLVLRLTGLEKKIQAGAYEFSPAMTLRHILWKLETGRIMPPQPVRITFPEGLSIYRMARLLEAEGVGNPDEFEALASAPIPPKLKENYPFLKDVKTDSLEGYLFPDTYDVPRYVSTGFIVALMLRRFGEVVLPEFKSTRRSGLSLHEIVTLASIIEKEAAHPEERPLIASVYYNRLRAGMRLDADPTVKYVLGQRIVRKADLRIDSPYNTYRYAGLPPGPIGNPGLASIKAALHPASTDYLYFVARPDGKHIFSKTLEEHNRARRQVGTIPIQ